MNRIFKFFFSKAFPDGNGSLNPHRQVPLYRHGKAQWAIAMETSLLQHTSHTMCANTQDHSPRITPWNIHISFQ